MAERAAHRDNLPLVMERMREDVMEDERGRADDGVSIGKMKVCIGDELEISQARKVFQCLAFDFLLQPPGIGDSRKLGGVMVGIGQSTKCVNPESFAIEDVNHLLADGRKAVTRHFGCIIARREHAQVVQDPRQAGVGPLVEFPNAVEGEHG